MMGKKPDDTIANFWETLGLLWTKDRVDAWKSQVLGPDGTEICQNLICLGPDAHELWDTARFALKYKGLSPDEKTLEVEFFWLPTRSSSDFISVTQVPSCFKAEAGYSNKTDGSKAAFLLKMTDLKEETCATIKSGEIIVLRTDDPVQRPLPSRELLDMQWILHRVRALKGAADEESGWDSESATQEEGDEEKMPSGV